MDLKTYLSQPGNTQQKLASELGVTQARISQMARNPLKEINRGRAIDIEIATEGEVTAKELRPDLAWPDQKREAAA